MTPAPLTRLSTPARLHRALLPLVFLTLAETAGAQSDVRRGFIGLAFGPAAPVGAFAEGPSPNAASGDAKPGYHNSLLSLSWRFGRRLGVAAVASYGEYSIGRVDGDDWWQVSGLTVGPMYAIPLGARTSLDMKGMLGWMGLTEVIDSYTSNPQIGHALMIDLRSTLRHDFARRWAVFADAGFVASNQTLGDGRRKDVRVVLAEFGLAFRPRW